MNMYENNEKFLNSKFLDLKLWLDSLYLDSAHLVKGPDIWFLRNGDDIYVRWLNQDKKIDEILVWTEVKGETIYNYKDFIFELKLFHENLMNEMDKRIALVTELKKNKQLKYDININELKKEQINKKVYFDMALSRRRSYEWKKIDLLLKALKG